MTVPLNSPGPDSRLAGVRRDVEGLKRRSVPQPPVAAWASIFTSFPGVSYVTVPAYPGSYIYDVDFTGGKARYSVPQLLTATSSGLSFDTNDSYVVVMSAYVTVDIQSVGGLASYHPDGLEMYLTIQGGMDTSSQVPTGAWKNYIWGGGSPTVVNRIRYGISYIDVSGVYYSGSTGVGLELANYDSTNTDVNVVDAAIRAALIPTVYDASLISPI